MVPSSKTEPCGVTIMPVNLCKEKIMENKGPGKGQRVKRRTAGWGQIVSGDSRWILGLPVPTQ